MIAAVNGMACGGAFYMLGEVEFVIAVEHATFFDPHVTYGMTASFEPIHMLHKMPFNEVMRMSLLGAMSESPLPVRKSSVSCQESCPVTSFSSPPSGRRGRIADAPPLVVQGTLRALWAAQELSRQQAVDLGYAFVSMGTSPESLAAGQKTFTSGERIKPRVR